VNTKGNQDVSKGVNQSDRADANQGDRQGRPYNTTKKRLAEGVYCTGDPGGRPGSRTRSISDARPEILEQDLAHRWHALPLAQSLPLINGGACYVYYAGRSGGPQGPDIRDAALQFAPGHAGAAAERVTGDVEFHIRCSDWYAHQHHIDPRYNNVILHVVLIFDSAGPVLRQDGHAVPICSLNDLVPAIFPQPLWPCQCIIPSMDAEARAALLQRAGKLRFEQKTQNLLAQLQATQPNAPFSAYDVCLIPALVEALGYGRDRAFFRAVGQRLVGHPGDIPEPAGRAAAPSPLDAGRLRISGQLVEQWRVKGAWEAIRGVISGVDDTILGGEGPGRGQARPLPYTAPLAQQAERSRVRAGLAPALVTQYASVILSLRAIFAELSPARADILICNVILPFAAAVATLEQDQPLLEQARELYGAYQGLSSNQVTRSMYRQLGLEREPKNACQQQGLHYIYAQTCREKRCAACIVVGRDT